ncbi:hypothetical protein AVEN_149465-1 [Araneus ventricosus]|uniref:Uncharacterized protein n=1 Tax=Araneus ventricosus TaxID=182803 RepID=A0A4Y2JNE2_ARAVE|nr:hypothetical protein AVEN_149465-1 [Araneus ventricosus]
MSKTKHPPTGEAWEKMKGMSVQASPSPWFKIFEFHPKSKRNFNTVVSACNDQGCNDQSVVRIRTACNGASVSKHTENSPVIAISTSLLVIGSDVREVYDPKELLSAGRFHQGQTRGCLLRIGSTGGSVVIALQLKPAGVVSPKLSRLLLEKGAVSPPPAWIKKFEPIVTQDPMTIRKYFGKKSNSKRCVPIKCIPISTRSWLMDNPSACTDCYQVRMRMENRMKKKRQAGVNKYRAQKIAFNTHARVDSRLVGDALIQTDRQSTF